MNIRAILLRVIGGIVAYGCLTAFLCLIAVQLYHWFRDGEWTHIGLGDGMRIGLTRCCVKDGDTGDLAAFVAWLEQPTSWLGLHKVFEVIPASIALFAVSMLGNCIFILGGNRIPKPRRGDDA